MKFFYLAVIACFLWQCKWMGKDSDVATIRTADDALKIATNYIGDANCKAQHGTDQDSANAVIVDNAEKVWNLGTHLLNGKNGELVSEEYKQLRNRHGLQFSGDKFFGKVSGNTLAMENIQDNCRRLVLSVDSDWPPTIQFHQGFALQEQWQGFDDIRLPEFGDLTCLTDRPFCTFSNINNKATGHKRYFTLIWPDQNTKEVSATVNWIANGKQSATITIPNLTYSNATPNAWHAPTVGEELANSLSVSYKLNRNFKRDMLNSRQSKVGNTTCSISTARQSEKAYILTGAVVLDSSTAGISTGKQNVSANLPASITSEKTYHFSNYEGIRFNLACSTFFNYYDPKTDSVNHKKENGISNIQPGQQVCIEFENSLKLIMRYPTNKEGCAPSTPIIFYF
ncbi:MAG: hypothetical protein OYH77_07120 [Pseudomonadota bacterium]|nr:hypothetical protein [Pseudomonadota bacterium]